MSNKNPNYRIFKYSLYYSNTVENCYLCLSRSRAAGVIMNLVQDLGLLDSSSAHSKKRAFT